MAVYYKFKSAKEYDSVVIDGHFISVGHLKEKIFELKHLGRGKDFDLVVTNAQTNEEYLDEGALIPKNTSVLIRRVPGCPRKPIVTAPVTELEEPIVENNIGDLQASKDSFVGAESSTAKYADDVDWDEFGNDLYAVPESVPVRSSIPVQDAAPVNKENEDEDSMIKALIETPALDWQSQLSNGFGPGRGFGRGMGGRMMGGRGFGGRGGFESRNPPPGYICHRCKVPGHFIHHCPTNGDPTFDLRRVKPPTGIPRSMLMATPNGSYALPSGDVAVLKPNEAAFEREIEGMPSTRSVGELPPELHCPVCKEVMKDAVLTSKCCFTSFCDKCIRDYIISKSMCVCGATNVLADDLLPNKTLRDTINRILESNDNSAEKGGSAFQVQDMESRIPQAKAPSPTQSAASKGHQMSAQPVQREETSKISEGVEETIATNAHQKQNNERTPKVPDVLEATHEVKSFRDAALQGSAQLVDEEVQQKLISGEEGKKKKKKKMRMPPGEMQWRGQDLAPENYMMPPPLGPSAFNPYWNGMPPGLESGFMPPYPGPMPYMGGYGFGGPMDVPFGGFMPPQDPFGGMGGMMPYGPPPPRDLAELAMGFNPGPPNMSREEFEAREAHKMKRRREMERRGEREMPRDHQEYGREANIRREVSKDRNYKDRDYYGREESSKVDVSPMKSKSKSTLLSNSAEHHHQPQRSDRRSRDPELPRPSSKRKSTEYDHSIEEEPHHQRRRDYSDEDNHRRHRSSQKRRSESPSETSAAADKKQKVSVFSRISFPGKDSAPKSKKLSSSSGSAGDWVDGSNGYYEEEQKVVKRSSVSVDYESSDDERHFKRRRPSKHNSSSPPPVEDHSRGHSKRR